MNPSSDPTRPDSSRSASDPSVRRSVRSGDDAAPAVNTGDFRTLVAIFDQPRDAERAISDLKESTHYDASEIGVAMRDRDAQGQLVHETGTHAVGGAVSGAVGGGVLGGVAGWLVAIGALSIPGVGPVIAGGALASALGITAGTAVAGAGIGAAAGGLVGALIGLGIPEKDAEYYDKAFREGRIIVTVRARDVVRATEIIRRHGGEIRSATAGTSAVGGTNS